MDELRLFIHNEKHSNLLLLSNYGLEPQRTALNDNMDVIFAELWQEPGVWNDDWNVSNIRRTKYLKGMVAPWKPMITEYSEYHGGNRSTMFLSAKAERLSSAEAAAFGSDYAWNMEGPFYDALMTENADALASWKAIGQYNRFLAEHKNLYNNVRQVAPILAVLPGSDMSFAWPKETSGLYDLLAKRSVLFDIRLANKLNDSLLQCYQAVIVPAKLQSLPVLAPHRAAGGKIYAFDRVDDKSITELLSIALQATSLALQPNSHILANVTRSQDGRELIVHILNYAATSVNGVRVNLNLGSQFRDLLSGKADLFSPDRKDPWTATLHRPGSSIAFTVDKLDTYTVAVLR